MHFTLPVFNGRPIDIELHIRVLCQQGHWNYIAARSAATFALDKSFDGLF